MPKLPITSADMDAGCLEVLRIIEGMQNGTATLENSLVPFFVSEVCLCHTTQKSHPTSFL